MSGAVTIRRVRLDDGPAFRALRLEALQDTPGAFLRTYAEEAAYPPALWEQRLHSNAAGIDTVGFIALADGRPNGLVVGLAPQRGGREVELVSMWVRADARSRGAGRALVEAVCAWAAGLGAEAVGLEVAATNGEAVGFYARVGFTVTGPGTHDPTAQRMRRTRLGGPAEP